MERNHKNLMRVALLTSGNSELSWSLIKDIRARRGVELLVIHTKPKLPVSWRIHTKKRIYIELRKRFLGEAHPNPVRPEDSNNDIFSPNINSELTYQSLLDFRPNLMIISGTKKVEKQVLELADYAVNLHHGFLPTYRGVSSIDWVTLESNFNYFVVSLHKAMEQLDAGPLVASCYVTPFYREPEFLFRRRVYLCGVELIRDFLEQFMKGSIEPLEPSKKMTGRVFKHADKGDDHNRAVMNAFAGINLARYAFWQRYRSYAQRNWNSHSAQTQQSSLKKYVLKSIIKRITRKSLAPGLYILTYHDICDENVADSCEANKAPMIYTSSSNFVAHLDYFESKFRCTSLGHGLKLLSEGILEQEACVALTFDDGFRGVTKHLYEMNSRDLTPTFFVCGNPVLKNKPLEIHKEYLAQKYASESRSDTGRVDKEFIDALRFGLDSASKFQRFLRDSYLDVSEIRSLLDAGDVAALGSHTWSHQNLAKMSHSEQIFEIADNHTELKRVFGDSLQYFSFPFGKLDRRSVDSEYIAHDQTPYVFECNGGINQKYGVPGGIVRIGIGNPSVSELDKLLRLQWTR